MSERRRLVGPDEQVSVRRQCELLGISRSGVYYVPVEPDAEELELMRQIDELHLEYPFYGSRNIARELREQGLPANRKRVQRLMRLMGLESVAPKPDTSQPNEEHPVYPYLLRGLTISRANQVWASDITYIPLARGYAYLVAIMDWHSRRVLSWRLSNTMDPSFCVEALQEALSRFGTARDLQLGPGLAVHLEGLHRRLARRRVKISMDGKGRCLDNVFVERLWRSLKYEDVYIRAYADLVERGGDRPLLRLLQQPSPAPGTRSPDPGRLLRRPTWHGRRHDWQPLSTGRPSEVARTGTGVEAAAAVGGPNRSSPTALGTRFAFSTAPQPNRRSLNDGNDGVLSDLVTEQATPNLRPFSGPKNGVHLKVRLAPSAIPAR